MATFVFNLESVLRHRRLIEDQRQRELAQSLRDKQKLEQHLREMQQTISSEKHMIGRGLIGTVNVAQVRHHGAHAGQVTFRAQQIAVQLMTLHKQVEQRRTALMEATKERKAVELLRAKQYEKWLAEQKRREQAESDELGVLAHGRRNTTGVSA